MPCIFAGSARVSSSPPCMDKPIKKKAAASIVIFYRSRRPCLALRAIFIFQPCRRFQKGKPPFEFRGFFRAPGLRSAGLHLVKICPPPAPRAGHSSHSSNVNSPFMPVLCHFASRISYRARSVSALSGLRPALSSFINSNAAMVASSGLIVRVMDCPRRVSVCCHAVPSPSM